MKTVRQLADEIGVSKQAVWQKIKKEPLSTKLEPCLTKSGRTVYFNEQGEIIVKTAFLQLLDGKSVDDVDDIDDKNDNNKRKSVVDMIDVIALLQGELESKNRLIESQSRQLEQAQATAQEQAKSIQELTAALENTTASLHAAQALHAGTMHKQLGAGDLQPEDTAEPVHPEPEKKPGLFARIFGSH